jgi:DNA polymerase III alpha subunit
MVCGQITNIKTIIDRKGGTMAFLTVEDFAGSAEALVFSDTYSAHRELLQPDTVVVLAGATSTREDEPTKILVEKVMSLDEAWNEIRKNSFWKFRSNKPVTRRFSSSFSCCAPIKARAVCFFACAMAAPPILTFAPRA